MVSRQECYAGGLQAECVCAEHRQVARVCETPASGVRAGRELFNSKAQDLKHIATIANGMRNTGNLALASVADLPYWQGPVWASTEGATLGISAPTVGNVAQAELRSETID